MKAKKRNSKEKKKLIFLGTQLFRSYPIFILTAEFPISMLSLSKYHHGFSVIQ